MFAPGFVFMAFQLSTDFSTNPKAKIGSVSKAHLHWIIAAVLSFIGVLALILLLNHPKSKKLLKEADAKLKKDQERKIFEETQLHNLSVVGGLQDDTHDESNNQVDESMAAVAKMIGAALISIFASIFAIVAIVSISGVW